MLYYEPSCIIVNQSKTYFKNDSLQGFFVKTPRGSVFFFPWKLIFLPWKKTQKVPVKRKKRTREKKMKKKVCVKIEKCPWKSKKVTKSVRENQKLCVKKVKKVCVKGVLPSVKKVEKRPKMAFTGTFDFHGGKKKRWASSVLTRKIFHRREKNSRTEMRKSSKIFTEEIWFSWEKKKRWPPSGG